MPLSQIIEITPFSFLYFAESDVTCLRTLCAEAVAQKSASNDSIATILFNIFLLLFNNQLLRAEFRHEVSTIFAVVGGTFALGDTHHLDTLCRAAHSYEKLRSKGEI